MSYKFKKILVTAMCCLTLTAFAISFTPSNETTTYGVKDDLPY